MAKLPHLSDEHHFAIACVAAHAAKLDHTIDSLVYLTIQPEEISQYLVKNVGADRLVELIKIAFLAELKEYTPKLNLLFETTKKLRGERNHVLHWLYEPTSAPDTVRFMDKRRGREAKPKDMTAKDIQKLADAIDANADELVEWWNLYNWHYEIRLHGKPSQLTHPPRWALPRALRPPRK